MLASKVRIILHYVIIFSRKHKKANLTFAVNMILSLNLPIVFVNFLRFSCYTGVASDQLQDNLPLKNLFANHQKICLEIENIKTHSG